MDRQEYLDLSQDRIRGLLEDPIFRNNLAQVRASAVQHELSDGAQSTGFTFSPERIRSQAYFIFSESSFLLGERTSAREELKKGTRVPAEAFEFLSKCSDEPNVERLLLDAAMCYQIAGYQANAQCLSRLIGRNEIDVPVQFSDDDTPESIDRLLAKCFRRGLIQFLKRDMRALLQLTTQSLDYVTKCQPVITRFLAEDSMLAYHDLFNLLAHGLYQRALRDFANFCLEGDKKVWASAVDRVHKSHGYFLRSEDATLSSMTAEFSTLLEVFQERSTWACIPNHDPRFPNHNIWRTYLRNLAFEKSIVELWPSQVRAINRGVLDSDDSFVIQMPTSAGKTLVAELAILAALTSSEECICLYVAPYRALATEIETKLAETLGGVGYGVSNLMGGFELDGFQDFLVKQSNVVVATPEKVELLFRTHPEFFDTVKVIVVDEGHIVDDGVPCSTELDPDETLAQHLAKQGNLGRGVLLELLVTRLKRRLPSARFIYLSAVMPEINGHDFSMWLSANATEPVFSDDSERPSRLLTARFYWRSEENGQLEYLNLPRLEDGTLPFVPYVVTRQVYDTGKLTETGKKQKKTWPTITNKAQTTAMLAAKCAKSGPVLVFCAQPSHVRTVTKSLVESLSYLEASGKSPCKELRYVEAPESESYQLAIRWLGEEHPLTQALHYNAALHYGPLPDAVREVVEDEFRSGRLRILVSTNTLGQGVNMPIKTAIIYSLERKWGRESAISGADATQRLATARIKKRDFWNICGRAGRAGKETEGQIMFVTLSSHDRELLEDYRNPKAIEEVQSALYRLLLNLIDRRISPDELRDYLDPHVLAILAEEIVDTDDEAAIEKFLGTSLVGIQAARDGVGLTPLASSIRQTAAWVTAEVPDGPMRQVFSSTGFRVSSCKQLERSVDAILASMAAELSASEATRLTVSKELLRAAFNACRSLPEMALKRTIDYIIPDNEYDLVEKWTDGLPIDVLRTEYCGPRRSECFGEYLSDRVIYKLPWGISAFLRVLSFKLGLSFEQLPLSWQHLPSAVKFGVNSVLACWICNLGVSSRDLARQVAAVYSTTGKVSFGDFIQWAVNLPIEYVFREFTGAHLEKVRFVKTLSKVVANRDLFALVQADAHRFVSPIRGIQYDNRDKAASLIGIGDTLNLEVEEGNPYDANAVRVVFNGVHVGYVQRDKSGIVARALRLGRSVRAFADRIAPPTARHPFPWIEMRIELGGQ